MGGQRWPGLGGVVVNLEVLQTVVSRLLAGHFARAVDALRTATGPAAPERVVPLGPHQVNRRIQVLAEALGLEGVSSHSGRRGLASELVPPRRLDDRRPRPPAAAPRGPGRGLPSTMKRSPGQARRSRTKRRSRHASGMGRHRRGR